MVCGTAQRHQYTGAEHEESDLRGGQRRDSGLAEEFPGTAGRARDVPRRGPIGFDPAAEPRPTRVHFGSRAAHVMDDAAFEGQLVAATGAGRKVRFDLDPVGLLELTGRVPRKQLLSLLVRIAMEIRHRLPP